MATGSIRTLTFPVASPDFLCFEDRLPHGETVEPSPEALLEAGEDQVLEVKGSAFTPLVPWFDGEERAEPPAYPNKTLLRAIASFLNSNDGTVLVGALEPTDYARGKETLGELETVGRFAVCGLVDVTFERDGWDRFALKLESLVADRIDPPPTGRVVVKPKHCLGKPTCVIRIESQPPTDGYFVKGDGAGHFYVRRGGAVHELRGNDIFEYVKQRRERVVAR
jgi:hypothetical protein